MSREAPHPYEDPAEIDREAADDMAAFCLATGVQPSEYLQLTRYQIDAFVRAVNKRK